jgi:hypothetical protein
MLGNSDVPVPSVRLHIWDAMTGEPVALCGVSMPTHGVSMFGSEMVPKEKLCPECLAIMAKLNTAVA